MTQVAIFFVIPQRMRLSSTVMEIWRLKDNGVTTLIFCCHVTSSVTWPFDLQWATSCRWSYLQCISRQKIIMRTIHIQTLSPTVKMA